MAFYTPRMEIDCCSIGSARTLMAESLKSPSSVTICDDSKSMTSEGSTFQEQCNSLEWESEGDLESSEMDYKVIKELPQSQPEAMAEEEEKYQEGKGTSFEVDCCSIGFASILEDPTLLGQDEDIDIVPPLDLRSKMDLSMSIPPTFSCHKTKLNCKMITQSNPPYEKWLAKKREAQVNEVARRKEEEERRKSEQEDRKRLSEEKYQNWLEKKRQVASSKKKHPMDRATKSSSSLSSSASTLSSSSSGERKLKLKPTVEKSLKVREWEGEKRKQEKIRRNREQQEAEERANLAARRREQSTEAFDRWMKQSKNRPKPVPLNQGILSLRGTISDIYVNPNEWKSILEK